MVDSIIFSSFIILFEKFFSQTFNQSKIVTSFFSDNLKFICQKKALKFQIWTRTDFLVNFAYSEW